MNRQDFNKLFKFTNPQLQELCRAARVDDTGRKDKMFGRFYDLRHEPMSATIGHLLCHADNAELQAACASRGLPDVSGSNRELVVHLLNADNAIPVEVNPPSRTKRALEQESLETFVQQNEARRLVIEGPRKKRASASKAMASDDWKKSAELK